MGRIPDIKRIRKEDFDQEYQGLIDRIAFSFNSFADQVINLFNKNINFENLNQEIAEVTVVTNSIGGIDNLPKLKSGLSKKVQGIQCIRASNINAPNVYPTSQPFISFSLEQNTLSVLNITGLQANSKYTLKLLLIAED